MTDWLFALLALVWLVFEWLNKIPGWFYGGALAVWLFAVAVNAIVAQLQGVRRELRMLNRRLRTLNRRLPKAVSTRDGVT